ncbi:N5-carboxyaminoimidazole ribonucleotide mutase [uncultured archaeon]|nr:N5-carboxyaminoimidazole ribonucleotide mutase [uncultured archaeon]
MELSDALKEVPGKKSDVRSAIEENKGFVVIMAGSDSDKPHIDLIVAALNGYGIKNQVRIASAHKEPGVVESLVRLYDSEKFPVVYVAVAGKTDALSGMISFLSVNPVVSCPPDHPNASCLNNPPGSSNAYVGDPKNLARYVAQTFSHLDPQIRQKLENERDGKIIKLIGKDKEFSRYPYEVEVK